jgi:hypothetical protein
VWTAPLGRPVDPDEYNQKAMSSQPVGAGAGIGACSAIGPASGDAQVNFSSWGAWAVAFSSTGASAGETSAACARQCERM